MTSMENRIGKPNKEMIIDARKVIRNRTRPTSTPESLIRTPAQCNLFSSGMVHCLVVRDTLLPSTNPSYSFMFQDTEGDGQRITVMMARKQGHAIRIWDTRKLPGDNFSSIKQLNKKSGNYLGKLKKIDKPDLSAFSVFDSKEDKEQIAAIVFDTHHMFQQWKEGTPPRKIKIAIPHVNDEGCAERLPPYLKNKMVESIQRKVTTGIQTLISKDPSFEREQYRLNFNGRVTMASVKNLQIVDANNVICAQFGKVGT